MSENDRIILRTILEQNKALLAPELTSNQYFELFSAQQVLKDFDLAYEEIQSANVGGPGDGGIDSFHVFANGMLVQEDMDISCLPRELNIVVYVIQSKLETGFGESTIETFDNTVKELLDLSIPIEQFKPVYNPALIEAMAHFRKLYTDCASRLPSLEFRFRYVTIGDEPHPNTARLVSKLRTTLKSLFSTSSFSFEFIGAAELLRLARLTPSTTLPLRLTENPISSGEQNFICLVKLADYFDFINVGGRLNKRIFEANVRDYQGTVQVNEAIHQTLLTPSREDFWWLNNGITMIATKISLSGKTLTIENPLVVNGMQTSFEIYKHFEAGGPRDDSRNILLRVIGVGETPDELITRNKIIRATNSQTTIQIASLRATDKIQYDIEDYLSSHGYYYDRRKNYYKNEGKPVAKIISITYLAQSVISLVLRRPNDARARPSTLLKDDKDYQSIFAAAHPMDLYLKCLQILKRVETYFHENLPESTQTDILNYKFHLAMFSSLLLTNNPAASAIEIVKIDTATMTNEFLSSSYRQIFEVFAKNKDGAYVASKSSTVVADLLGLIRTQTFPAVREKSEER